VQYLENCIEEERHSIDIAKIVLSFKIFVYFIKIPESMLLKKKNWGNDKPRNYK